MNHEEIRNPSFDELLAGLLKFLKKEKSYNQTTLDYYYQRLHKISSYMQTQGINLYTPDVGVKYYETFLAEHDSRNAYQKSILTTIRRLNAFCTGKEYVVQYEPTIELLPEDYELALIAFGTRCSQHGNKEITVKVKDRCLRRFLKDCIALGCTSIESLTSSYITRACLRVENKDSWVVIRDFLKLMNVKGILNADLSTLVPHHRKSFKIPTIYSEDEISKIEKVIDRSSDIGKRDYAMLLLASRLGLRSGDIVTLTLDELDFYNDKISFVQQKTGETLELPMLPEIKEALENYIINARPKTSDHRVFIRHYAPYQCITTSVLRYEISRYFRAAGIDITGKKHGLQTFRSSLASSMVNDAIPYEAVRKILGHSSPNAIKHYAKLDIEILRRCAIVVPEPSGKFKEFLDGGMYD